MFAGKVNLPLFSIKKPRYTNDLLDPHGKPPGKCWSTFYGVAYKGEYNSNEMTLDCECILPIQLHSHFFSSPLFKPTD